MTYSELQKWSVAHGTTIKAMAAQLGMTPLGFRHSVEKETLPLAKVRQLCQLMNITPNDLLGIESADAGVPTSAAFNALLAQLATKDEQIKILLNNIK